MQVEYFIAIASISVSILTLMVVLLIFVRSYADKRAKERYDFEKHRVELDYMRENLERQVFEASKKLEETENRWRDVNHLLIASQKNAEQAPAAHLAPGKIDFLTSLGINDPNDFRVDRRLVFALTPFNTNYLKSFKVIKETCEKLQLKCIRGDEEFVPNEIFPTIVRYIVRARIVVCNISGRNPNVLYELGIAHALGKPTLLVARNLADVPFDLGTKRIVLYRNYADLRTSLEPALLDLLVATDD